MKLTIDRRTLLLASSAALIARPSFAAETHTVEMLNKDPDDSKARMVFKPNLVVVQAGDTISFVGTDRGHNCEVIDGMVPEGAEGWKGKINDDIEVTLDQPGFYGYKCTPHVGQGMVGLVIVQGDGMMDNLEAAQSVRQRGQAKKRWGAIWEEAEAQGLLSA
ncbi:MAG: pseudoazurin [Pseudomonadota bacterium]